MNQVGFNDFLKWCYISSLKDMARFMQTSSLALELSVKGHRGPTFIELVRRLFDILGGNYRMLEFFTGLVSLEPEKLPTLLDSLETFERNIAEPLIQARQQMRENLLFSHLFSLLTVEQQRVLRVLSFFRVPVLELALRQQGESSTTLVESLSVLNRLTLLEASKNPKLDKEYYYVTLLIKDLLSTVVVEPAVTFNHEAAGQYFDYSIENEDGDLVEYEEAFYHYDLAKTKARIAEIGQRLTDIYYSYSLFNNALHYALRVYEHMGEETEATILNDLGLIYQLLGSYEGALSFFLKAKAGNKKIGDKKGEGATLNNISQIFKASGDSAGALAYLEQSMSIRREIGDKAGEGATLTNLAIIADQNQDPDKYLAYETEAYHIATEINDAMGIYAYGRDLGFTLAQAGEKEKGLSMLYCSLKIGTSAGFPNVGKVEEYIQRIERGE